MGFKTWNAGDLLTASDLMTYLMNQAVIVCTSSTRPGSPVTGMTIFETDTLRALVYNGTAWETMSPAAAAVLTSENSTSTVYANLTTAGPTVSAYTGTSALLAVSCKTQNTAAGNFQYMAIAVSGATTLAASDANGATVPMAFLNAQHPLCAIVLISGLTAGNNTFQAKYKTSANTGTWLDRRIAYLGRPT